MRVPDRVRALVLAGVWGLLFLLATPGLDAMPSKALTSDRDRRELAERVPAWLHPFAYGLVAFNNRVRRPVTAAMVPFQTPLRIRQEWNLYLDGPRVCQRLEIEVDGRLVHRTKDPAYAWRADLLRAPSIRPIVDGTAGKDGGGGNWRGLMRLVVREVLAEAPEARRVVLRGVWGAFPRCVGKEHHAFVAEAPGWEGVKS